MQTSRLLADCNGELSKSGIPIDSWIECLGGFPYDSDYRSFRTFIFEATRNEKIFPDRMHDKLRELCPATPLRFLSLMLFSLVMDNPNPGSSYTSDVMKVCSSGHRNSNPSRIVAELCRMARVERAEMVVVSSTPTNSNHWYPIGGTDDYYAALEYATCASGKAGIAGWVDVGQPLICTIGQPHNFTQTSTNSNLSGNQIMTNTALFKQVTITTINGRNTDSMSMNDFIDAIKGAEKSLAEINELRKNDVLSGSKVLADQAVKLLEDMQQVVKAMDEKFAEKK
jgi:hypothetical protein